MSSAASAQQFVTKLMTSSQNRALAMEADTIRGLLGFARQLQPGDPKHVEYRGKIGHILFFRVQNLISAATMFDPIFLSAAVEITTVCKNKQWVGIPNWQDIREDDPRIEKHPLINKTWYVHPNQQMLQAFPEGAILVAEPPAATADDIPLLTDNASVASGAIDKRQLRVFGPKSQAHAKENADEDGALPTDQSRGRSNHRVSKKRGINESESRTPLAGAMRGGSYKRICADTRSNTVNKMGEGASKGVIYVQHPEAKTKTPTGLSLKAAGSSANPLTARSGAVSVAGPCPRCVREGKTCMRARGKTGLLLVCTACKRLKKKCELDVNQPTRQRRKSGVQGSPHPRLSERIKARKMKMSIRRMGTSVVQRRPPRVVMSYVSVPQLPIPAPESTIVQLRSVKRKMSSMEGVIDLLHREMETLRTILDTAN
ncbi:uncharacterized protein BJ212DRAFT_1342858 [Suillus subaureus]|uniref:Zn(2)-C6 fungal-type domain-containing protein n=1 Tax=Suillus subaureus TaxID=48587 RepID=A0A9P7JFS6_9AGAM|nr:uncharacterized protein BJ212DRAFT_1342858 [Suillus subaureus]KAG1819760.1 hypothetical protein BJ212DRAFT_1342858 [Suillus subaureus]